MIHNTTSNRFSGSILKNSRGDIVFDLLNKRGLTFGYKRTITNKPTCASHTPRQWPKNGSPIKQPERKTSCHSNSHTNQRASHSTRGTSLPLIYMMFVVLRLRTHQKHSTNFVRWNQKSWGTWKTRWQALLLAISKTNRCCNRCTRTNTFHIH